MRGKWITPSTDAPATLKCWRFLIPDDVEWLAPLKGAVDELRKVINWEQIDGVTPEEAADVYSNILFEFDECEECEPTVTDLIIIQEQKANSTHGGTFTAGADRTRALSVEVLDTGNHASLSANQITLQPGTYRGSAWAIAWYVGAHRLKLYNVTDAITVVGSSEWIPQANQQTGHALITFQFTITAAKVFELRHRCSATAESAGFGFATGLGTEIYSEIKLERIGD